jgi:uncharacterized protein (TIRG00374 family)
MLVKDSLVQRKTILTRTIPFIAVGLAAFIAYLVFFVNVNEMMSILGQTNILVFLVATTATILELVFFALTWQFFLKPLSANVPFKNIFLYTWFSNFVDLMIPAESVSGEISRVVCVMRHSVDSGKAAASVVTQRILGMCIVAGTLAIGAFSMIAMRVPLPAIVQSLTYLIISVTVFLLSIAMLIFARERWAHTIAEKVVGCAGWVSRGRLKTQELKRRARRVVTVFYESLRVFRANPRKFVLPLTFAIATWFFAILGYYLAFAAVGYTMDWIVVIIGYSLVIGVKAIPFGVPAEIGVTEIALTVIFGAFGVPLYISAAAVVLIRIMTVWFRIVIGFVTFQLVGFRTMAEIENMFFNKK